MSYQIPSQTIRIVLTGGGSGGHTFPLIAVARELRKMSQKKGQSLELFYIGPDDFAADFVRQEGIAVKTILGGKFRRDWSPGNLLKNIVDIFKIIGGLVQTYYYLLVLMPDAIFSKGGYGSFPVVFWGIIFAIPIFVHESDAVPGLMNKMSAKFSRTIFVSFPDTQRYFPQHKTIVTGNPIRIDLVAERIDPSRAKELLKLDNKRPLVLVLGGSQGAQHINDIILDILPEVIDRVQIVHQTGNKNYQQVQREAEIVFREIIKSEENKQFYHPYPFLIETDKPVPHSLKFLYAAADLIIARAGSGLIFEIAAVGKPSIIIPLPWASQGHQLKNAYAYEKSGACVVVEEKNLRTNIFSDLILRLLQDKKKLAQMSKAALSFAKPQAAEVIAQYLWSRGL